MKKVSSGLFLFLFIFQVTVSANTTPPVPESKLKKTGRTAAGWIEEAGRSVLDFTYTVMRKLDLAG